MRKSRYLRLVIRIFVRQIEDASVRIAEIVKALKAPWLGLQEMTLSEVREYLWPLNPSNGPEVRAKGLLVVEGADRKSFLVIREQEVRIACGSRSGEPLVAEAIKRCGQVFAVVQIVDDYCTELQAV